MFPRRAAVDPLRPDNLLETGHSAEFGLRTGVPINGRWRPHPIGHLRPLARAFVLAFERRLHSASGPSRADPVRRVVGRSGCSGLSEAEIQSRISPALHRVPAPIFIASNNCPVDSAEKLDQSWTFASSTAQLQCGTPRQPRRLCSAPDEHLWSASGTVPTWQSRRPHRSKSWDNKSVICSS
ncbi:hypothetical protein LMG28138_03819 [Pararobbsia alpina]|uniref:Uncharacterized protein n=1 Tax=Pararobbsia alpina TaxID=621374 RepID=A0A6S7CQ64_9BURK|nr:hypothetical protein LMG28138_03819 [Pararobbsia alpina]